MISYLTKTAVILVTCQRALATPCFLAGQPYPVPTAITTEPIFRQAMQNFERDLNARLSSSPFNSTSFSIGIFSASDDDLSWQYHHTSKLLTNSSRAAQAVDADSVYRIGSISKLLTVYLWLLAGGESHWHQAVASLIPEVSNVSSSGQNAPDWNEITAGDLAGQMAGLSRDFGLEDLAVPNGLFPPLPEGLLPRLPLSRIPSCGYLNMNRTVVQCSETEYLQGISSEPPVFQTAYTPAYSNAGFAVLGIALSRLANSSVQGLFDHYLVEGLGMKSSFYTVPGNISRNEVIPGSVNTSGWANNLGLASPAGGYFSSTKDLAKLGRAILTSEKLPPATTRRWLKPTSFVEDVAQGVGRPWEIFRQTVDGHTVEIYSKSGDWGVYSSVFALIPDYNVGFSVLTAADDDASAGLVRNLLPNMLSAHLLPATDTSAKLQARVAFAGQYTSSAHNSSIAVDTDDLAGLRLTSWINNGTDMYGLLAAVFGPDLDWRLLPNDLYSGGQVGSTALYRNYTSPYKGGAFTKCPTWITVDQLTFGNVPLGHFVFSVNDQGTATNVDLVAIDVRLKRVA